MSEASMTTGSAGAGPVRALLKKVFPDHWTFLLSEVAMYSFVVLIVTGTFLALFFQPLAMIEGFLGYSLPDDSCPAPASGSPRASWKGSRSWGPT
jgi:hypothetical protein